MGSGMMGGGGMMHGMYGQFDSRFADFSDLTLEEISVNFGISLDDMISDLGLPEDVNTDMTLTQIEEEYDVSLDQVANYVVLHMRNTPMSINSRDRVFIRQQAMYGIRSQGMVQGLHFMTQGRSAYGNYSTFTYEDGEMTDFAVSGDLIFDSVEVLDFDPISENIQGSTAVYLSDSSQINIHDNPMSTFQVRAFDDMTVVFDLSEDVEASIVEDKATGTALVEITKGNFEGYLVVCTDCLATGSDAGGAGVSISDDMITVELAEGTMVMFRSTPMLPRFHQTMYQYSNTFTHMHQRISQGIALGHVGAEVTIRDRGNTASLVSYTSVDVHIRETMRNRVVMNVSSELEEGQVITINLDDETIDLSRPERLRLRFDGQVLHCADNIDELFEGGEEPLCYMLQENETVSMAVYIPHFSEREIIIDLEPEDESEEEPTDDTDPTPGFGVLLAAAALGAAYYRRRM